jgi:translation initiation factor IF-1
MPNDDYLQYEGVVSQAMGNAKFLVTIEDVGDVICTISGRMKKNTIRILEGDKVSIDVSTYDPTKGRITYRFKK